MAEKISTLILNVDLECYLCTKKIKKVLLRLQDSGQIQSANYDEKKNTVTVSGIFDPQRLKRKLFCKAGRVIKEIKIKEEEKKLPPAQKEAKPAEPEKPKPAQPEKAKPAEPPKPKPAEPEKEKPKPPAPEPKKDGPVQENQPVWPAWPLGPPVPVCCFRPCYEPSYGGCRCCSCGMFFGWAAPPLPPAGVYPPTHTCHFFCEEDNSCRIM